MNEKKEIKNISKLNSLFTDIVSKISGMNTSKRDFEIEKLNKEIDEIVYKDIKDLTKFSQDDIGTFVKNLFKEDRDNSNRFNGLNNISDIFEDKKNSALFAFLEEDRKNKNLLYDDLHSICSLLNELNECVLATRDSMLSADETSGSISRNISFHGKDTSSDRDAGSYIEQIEDMERKLSLKPKLRNHVITNLLTFGSYYVYTIPYSKLFEKYLEKKDKGELDKKHTLESLKLVNDEDIGEIASEMNIRVSSKDYKTLHGEIKGICESISIDNDDTPIPILENAGIGELLDFQLDQQRKKISKTINKSAGVMGPGDGVLNTKKKKDGDKFGEFTGCYFQMIDPRKLIPIKILHTTIGYYYIYSDSRIRKSPISMNVNLLSQRVNEDGPAFLNHIVDRIVKSFNRPFLTENAKFKDLILDALTYNDLYKRDIQFQFIPAEYITEFKINPDENGEGVSILKPALFYAKLYLALLIFKIIAIITRSTDQKIFYVKNSGIDKDVVNNTQSIARQIKEGQINLNDLLNYNSLVSKVGKLKDIFMPVGQSDQRGIEFDILAGQDIQLHTDLMDMLKRSALNATGTPSVIIQYLEEADYAKTLVMAHNKYLQRIVNLQMDVNPSLTELYRKLAKFSCNMDEETVNGLEVSLAPPKSLDTTVLADLLSNADQLIQFFIKAETGENSDQTAEDNKLKDILYKDYAREILSMLPWADIDRITEEGKLKVKKAMLDKQNSSDDES